MDFFVFQIDVRITQHVWDITKCISSCLMCHVFIIICVLILFKGEGKSEVKKFLL